MGSLKPRAAYRHRRELRAGGFVEDGRGSYVRHFRILSHGLFQRGAARLRHVGLRNVGWFFTEEKPARNQKAKKKKPATECHLALSVANLFTEGLIETQENTRPISFPFSSLRLYELIQLPAGTERPSAFFT